MAVLGLHREPRPDASTRLWIPRQMAAEWDVLGAPADAVRIDPMNVVLALVNWMVLLLLLCGFLLATTLPLDSKLTGSDGSCPSGSKACVTAQHSAR
ncbi:MAG TPA: hypothetical protein VE081_07660 [Sporichthyaceae bacterium]|nr:hypothetical protein [Sporichthyaceae bacterium]